MVRFLGYGIFGWCTEIVWTALYMALATIVAGRRIDWRLQGHSYLWMLPIYGAGGLAFEVAHGLVTEWSWLMRGLLYMVGCFAVEWLTGAAIKRATGKIPWDYSYARWNVRGLIRLDYAPVWFCFGLILEHVEVVVRRIDAVF